MFDSKVFEEKEKEKMNKTKQMIFSCIFLLISVFYFRDANAMEPVYGTIRYAPINNGVTTRDPIREVARWLKSKS